MSERWQWAAKAGIVVVGWLGALMWPLLTGISVVLGLALAGPLAAAALPAWRAIKHMRRAYR